jgi:hypothetical protein
MADAVRSVYRPARIGRNRPWPCGRATAILVPVDRSRLMAPSCDGVRSSCRRVRTRPLTPPNSLISFRRRVPNPDGAVGGRM